MKRINQLALFAIVLAGIFTTQSCSKTKFYPGKLEGTWNSTELVEKTTATNIYQDNPANDDDVIKTESTSETQYSSSGEGKASSKTTTTYDGTGTKKSIISDIVTKDGVRYTTSTSNNTDNTSVIVIDTANITFSKNVKVVFNDDKTFTMTTTSNETTTSVDEDASRKRTDETVRETTNTITGSWAFIGADDNKDFKSNERIGFWFTKDESNSKRTRTVVYVDKDPSAGNEYQNETEVTTSELIGKIKTSEPGMVWEMIEGDGENMKVTFVYETSRVRTSTTAYTVGNTTNTSTNTSNEEESNIATFTFAKSK